MLWDGTVSPIQYSSSTCGKNRLIYGVGRRVHELSQLEEGTIPCTVTFPEDAKRTRT